MEFAIPKISELSTEHLLAVVALTIVTVFATRLSNFVINKLSGSTSKLLSSKNTQATKKYRNKALSDSLVTIIYVAILSFYIYKNDQEATTVDVLVIVIVVLIIIFMFLSLLYHIIRYQMEKEREEPGKES